MLNIGINIRSPGVRVHDESFAHDDRNAAFVLSDIIAVSASY